MRSRTVKSATPVWSRTEPPPAACASAHEEEMAAPQAPTKDVFRNDRRVKPMPPILHFLSSRAHSPLAPWLQLRRPAGLRPPASIRPCQASGSGLEVERLLQPLELPGGRPCPSRARRGRRRWWAAPDSHSRQESPANLGRAAPSDSPWHTGSGVVAVARARRPVEMGAAEDEQAALGHGFRELEAVDASLPPEVGGPQGAHRQTTSVARTAGASQQRAQRWQAPASRACARPAVGAAGDRG